MEELPEKAPKHSADRLSLQPLLDFVKTQVRAAQMREDTGSLTITLPMKSGVIGACKISTERYFNVRQKGKGTKGGERKD